MSTDSAIEVKKDGLSQLQDGSWVLKLKVHPNDMAVALMQAPMGTRFMAALVEIGDDEQPVEKEKRSFDELPLSQQAALCCQDARFLRFLGERGNISGPCSESDAAEVVRLHCKIHSRAELGANQDAAQRWRDLYSEFLAWKML